MTVKKSVTRDEPGFIRSLPRRVRIGSYTFAMSVVPGTAEHLDGDLGVTVFDPFRILVNEEQSLQGFMNTVLHELQHGINYVYGLESGAEEEAIARQSANGWQALLIDNAPVSRWIFDASTYIRKQHRREAAADRKEHHEQAKTA